MEKLSHMAIAAIILSALSHGNLESSRFNLISEFEQEANLDAEVQKILDDLMGDQDQPKRFSGLETDVNPYHEIAALEDYPQQNSWQDYTADNDFLDIDEIEAEEEKLKLEIEQGEEEAKELEERHYHTIHSEHSPQNPLQISSSNSTYEREEPVYEREEPVFEEVRPLEIRPI